MQAERNDFNIHLGDTIYSDSEVPGAPPADRADGRAEMGQVQDEPRATVISRRLRGSAGFYSHWDDHEFINDFSPAENTFSTAQTATVNINGRPLYRRGVRAFRDYAPVTYSRARGHLPHLPLGEERRAVLPRPALVPRRQGGRGRRLRQPADRRARPGADRAAGYAQPFAAVVPSLAQPVSQAVPGRDQRPDRDYLGDAQYRRFTRAIERSTARFKVIMNEMPIQQYYVLPYDRWEGYAAERRRPAAGSCRERSRTWSS